MLTVDNLTKRFGTKAAVDCANFDVPEPMMIGIIGRSGAGKSTLLRMMNRLADATEGNIRFEGEDFGAGVKCKRALSEILSTGKG